MIIHRLDILANILDTKSKSKYGILFLEVIPEWYR